MCLVVKKTKTLKQKEYCNKFNKDFKNGPLKKKSQSHKTKDNLYSPMYTDFNPAYKREQTFLNVE